LGKKQKRNKSFTICLTHDVDRIYKSYQCITHFIKALKKGDLKNAFYHILSIFHKNPYWNFNEIIRIENKYNVKSTFFFLNESIKFNPFILKSWKLSLGRYSFNDPKVREIIQWLDKNGWEIGLHGSYNSYNNLRLLKTEKEQLEKIVGHKVIGIRQHYLNLNKNTWKLQAETGLKYDTSYGFTKSVGFKNNKKFIVIPLASMDSCLMNKKNIKKEYINIINLVQKNNGVLVLNWHQRIFNEREFPNYSKIYENIIEECKKRGAYFCTCKELIKGLK